jgi:hypothetical protein
LATSGATPLFLVDKSWTILGEDMREGEREGKWDLGESAGGDKN